VGLAMCWIGPEADHDTIGQQCGHGFKKYHWICVCAVGYKSKFSPMLIWIFNAITSQNHLTL
jgi:hypothetical protein